MRRRRRRNRIPFQARGVVLTVLVVASLWWQLWLPAAVFGAALIFYLLFFRPARCRVQNRRPPIRPCRWPVRGLFGTCRYHVGYKRGLPIAKRFNGDLLPALMWPDRESAWDTQTARKEGRSSPQRDEEPESSDARTFGVSSFVDLAGLIVGVLGVLIAFVGLIHDFVAG